MGFQLNLYTVPLYVSAAIALGLLLLTVPQRRRKGAWPMIGFLSAIFVWTMSYALMLGSTLPLRRLWWHNVRFLGPTLATLSIFLFAMEYTGRGKYVTRRTALFLAAIPIVTNILVWTNGSHQLVRTVVRVVEPPGALVRLEFTWGPWYYLHALYSYLLTLGALVLFVEKYLRLGESEDAIKQTRTMMLATVLPLLGNVVYVAGLTRIDFAPFTFAISAVLLLAAIAMYS